MKLNPDSWFFRKYLGWRRLPNTVCDLIKVTLVQTLYYCFYVLIGFISIGSPIFLIISYFYKGIVTNDGIGEKVRAIALVTVILELLIIAFCVFDKFWELLFEWKLRRQHDWEDDVYKPPGKLSNFVHTLSGLTKAVYARVKDKTCVIIEYTKD